MNAFRSLVNRQVDQDLPRQGRTILRFAVALGSVQISLGWAEAIEVPAPAPTVITSPASTPEGALPQPGAPESATPETAPAEGGISPSAPAAGVSPPEGASDGISAPAVEGAMPSTPGAAADPAMPAAPPVPEVIRWAGGEGGFEFVAPTDAAQPEKVRFGFQETPWPVVLEQFARWEKLSLDLTDTPPGTFTYFDDQPRSPAEAVDVLNGYLLPRGYVVIRRHNFLVCVRTDSPQIADLIPTVSIDDLATRGEQELVRVVVRTPDVEPEAAAIEIEQLLGQHGSAKPLRNLQAVVVQGFGRSLRDAVAVIDGVAPPAKADKLQFKSFPLRYVTAADAEMHVRDLFGLGSGTLNVSGARTEMERELRYRNGSGERRGGDDNNNREQRPTNDRLLAQVTVNTQVSAVASTNNLLVTSTEEGLALIENVITSIDVPRGDGLNGAATEKLLRVYATSDASAEEVAKTLDVLMPGVLVNEDRRQDSLHIYATAEQHLEVADLIRTLDGGGEGGRTVAVIPLRKYDAYVMSELLSGMFENEDRDERPVIQPEAASRTLVVRGTTQQVEQVRTALAAYGEGQTDQASAPIGSRFRTIEVHADDAENIVRTAERILADTPGRDAGIRVVVPNAVDDEAPKVRIPTKSGDPETDEVSAVRRIDLDQPSSGSIVSGDASLAGHVSAENRIGSDATFPAEHDPSFRFIRTIAIEGPEAATTNDAESVAEAAPTGEGPASEQPPVDRSAEEDGTTDEATDGDAKPRSSEGAARPAETPRVQAVVRDGKIQLYSSDQRALDEVEEIVRELARTMPGRTNWTVFYLRAADASQTASTLYSLMPEAMISSLFAPSPYDAAGAGSTPEAFDVVPEPRTNALFVSGSSAQIKRVEQLLEILDTVDVPPSLVARTPRSIPVRYADVNQIAALVQALYKDRLTDPATVQREEEARRQQGGDGRNRGGEEDRGDDGQRRQQEEQRASRSQGRGGRPQQTGPQLTIAVDPIARELIVSCDEALFREISAFVESRDQIARDTRESIDIVRLPQSFPAESQAVLQVLQSISPNVTVTTVETPLSAPAPAPSYSRGFDSRSYSGRSDSRGSYRSSRDSR